ncbi:MAG: type II CAAX prenyl endopeptidase Rce1 family protein, partial [Verrucomicrobiota bacterium]
TPGGLLQVGGTNLVLFGGVFLVAVALGRPSRRELHGTSAPGWMHWLLGFAWSIALRLGVGVILFPVAAASMALRGREGPADLEGFRPKIENLLNPEALADPAYLLVCATFISFLVAGLREELWRAGMIAGVARLLAGRVSPRQAELAGVAFAAVVFGFGHLTQGWAGVLLTGVLGLGLGGILILRRSLAEVVIAHGFFDATTFVALAILTNRDLLRRLGVDPTLLDPLLNR